MAVFFRPARPVWLDHAPIASAVVASITAAISLRRNMPAIVIKKRFARVCRLCWIPVLLLLPAAL